MNAVEEQKPRYRFGRVTETSSPLPPTCQLDPLPRHNLPNGLYEIAPRAKADIEDSAVSLILSDFFLSTLEPYELPVTNHNDDHREILFFPVLL